MPPRKQPSRRWCATASKRRQGVCSGKTEPHQHDYDVCLYIVEGEIRLAEVETGTVHVFRAGEQALVNRGTLHSEEHGALKMVVGRRH